MEAGSAIYAVAIEKSHRSGALMRTHFDQFFGQGSAFEKGECGARVKFDVAGHKTSHRGPRRVCSLGRSVVAAFDEPFLAEQVVRDAVECDVRFAALRCGI